MWPLKEKLHNMKKTMTSNRTAFAGLFSAFVASLCCITPVLVLLSGTTGIASTFSWIEPYRPVLMGVTVLILGFAWYQKFNMRPQQMDCACEDGKPKFIQSKAFLFLVTIFAGTMLAFPYYSQMFYPNSNAQTQIVYVSEINVSELTYSIEGMTCAGCEAHIENEVNKLEGILEVDANYGTSQTFIKFDNSKVSPDDIASAIGKTGYEIVK